MRCFSLSLPPLTLIGQSASAGADRTVRPRQPQSAIRSRWPLTDDQESRHRTLVCARAIKFSGVANYNAKVRNGRAADPNEPSLIDAIKSQRLTADN